MITGIWLSIMMALIFVAFYVMDFYYMSQYDRENQQGKKGWALDYLLFTIVAVLLILIQPIIAPGLAWTTASSWGLYLQILGSLIIISSFALHIWARRHLRKFYVERVEIQADHRVINTGPYSLVRHPIITSFFALTGGVFLINPAITTGLVFLYTLWDFTRSAKQEEKLLSDTVPGYTTYMQKTPAFFPRIRKKTIMRAPSMLKKILRIPDTFDPDEHRRRQVLNVLLLFCMVIDFIGCILALLAYCKCVPINDSSAEVSLVLSSFLLIFLVLLLFMNRSHRIPYWLSGALFVLFLLILFSQADPPAELYNGRSTIVWAIPIMLGAILFPPGYSFLITLIICALMQLFTPSDSRFPTNSVNYYSMLTLLFIAFISWLGMSIANRAIRDAHHHANESRHHAANLQAILNSIADGVLVLDVQGNFVSANPALLKMIPEESLRQMNASPLEETLQWKQKVFSVAASPVPEVGSVLVFRDETRRHETERAKDSLLATASHELRTPLAAVMNYIELMMMLIETNKIDISKFKSHLMRASENSQRLQRLINNILDQAQIQAGMLVLKPQRFNLADFFEKNAQMLETLFKQKNLTYNLNIAPDVPAEISADPERLSQVIINLLSNAIKFTRQGSIQLNISTANQENICIEVKDTGAGIPAEQLPDIFEPFRRSSDYAMREQQGAGLGLSITKQIIRRMGGEISAASTPGVGSTFTVLLPIESLQG